MNTVTKFFSLFFIFVYIFLNSTLIYTDYAQASTPITIGPICDFSKSVATVNNSRDHWDGEAQFGIENTAGTAIDFGIQGVSGAPETSGQPYGNFDLMCENSNVYAAFSGTIQYAEGGCNSTMIQLVNTEKNLKLEYVHLNITIPNGAQVTAGEIIGTASSQGCKGHTDYIHNHVILRKNSDYSILTYSSQYTNRFPNQWVFAEGTSPTTTTQNIELSGDFNGDDKSDLVKIYNDNGYNSVRVLLANTQGSAFNKEIWSLQNRIFSDTNRWFVGNFDNDSAGKDDLALVYQQNNQNYITVFTSTGTSFNSTNWLENAGIFSTTDHWFSEDFTGDGVPDLARVYNDLNTASISVYPSTGNSFNYSQWITKNGSFAGTWLAADFTGGSKADIAHIYVNATNKYNIRGFRSKGDGFVLKDWILNEGSVQPTDTWKVGRFNDDEKIDLAKIYTDEGKNSIKMLVSQGEALTKEAWLLQEDTAQSTDIWTTGNFTNEGTTANLTDIAKIYKFDGQVHIKLLKSTGTAFNKENWLVNEGPYNSLYDHWQVGDYNNDGKDDISKVINDGGNNSARVMTSTGTSFDDTYWILNEGPYNISTIWF